MNAIITYRLSKELHPYSERQRAEGVRAWVLMKIVTPMIGNRTEEPIAIFNLDSEAETFMGHVLASDLDGVLITIDPLMRELLERRRAAGLR